MRDKWGPFQLSTFTKALHMDHTALCTPFIQTIIDISIKVSGILMKYRPFWCNIDHKFKNIDHLSKMVNYRPMVDNIDPLASLAMVSTRSIIVYMLPLLIYLTSSQEAGKQLRPGRSELRSITCNENWELYIHSVQDVLKVEGEHRKGSSGVRP